MEPFDPTALRSQLHAATETSLAVQKEVAALAAVQLSLAEKQLGAWFGLARASVDAQNAASSAVGRLLAERLAPPVAA